jgi:hypothetical protein
MNEIHQAILDTLRCVGAEKGIIYVTVPITTGLRELKLMHDLHLSRDELRRLHPDRWTTEVKRTNEADAKAFTTMVQLLNEDRLVLNPAELQVETWSQDEYAAMWNDVLSQFCEKLVLTPDWAFSRGARSEVQRMLLLKRPIVDIFGAPVSPESLKRADDEAVQRMTELSWTPEDARAHLGLITIPAQPVPRPWARTGQDDVIRWVIKARRWQNQIPQFSDRERTQRDLPRAEHGEWREKLDKYLNRAAEAEFGSNEAGTNILIFLSLAVAMMEHVAEAEQGGPFPEPGVPTGAPVTKGRINASQMDSNQRLALTMAWLLRETHYVREKFSESDDDTNTQETRLKQDGWWYRQLYWYWMKAHEEGLDTEIGRRMLGKFTSTALGLASSWVRLFKVPPQPRLLAPEELRRRGIFD